MPFEQKKARAIALMDSKKMWRSNYAPPLLRILWRLGIRLPPLPFMPFWQVAVLTGGLWGTSWGARRIRKKSYAKVFRASVRAETSRLPVCGSAARRNRRLG